MSSVFVSIIMGSDSDLPVMQSCIDTLTKLEIACEVKISSAHRTPDITRHYIADAEQRGCQVFIGAAGLAAHLAGTIAAHTLKPVIGVPMDGGPLKGMDALLSTVQMPGGIPVASVAIGKAGAKNAAYLAAQMLALSDPSLEKRIIDEREDNAKAVVAKDAQVQQMLAK
ncbi:N5-carboxyaminoimidazole ribonucleotide mutase [hydrothermal vent metagenome]|uniref:N5-carboxyaminoimidazole ribonucleotide mutase n=1 Tax=hydrothermal vent metagenome TaxID=652676 RepID=A0A3B1AKZ1_9ZZZZ